MERWTHNFYAYWDGKQVYKAWGAFLSKEEGRAQSKQIWTSLAQTNAQNHLVVYDEQPSKHVVEAYDGAKFTLVSGLPAVPPPPAPKCPPGQVFDASGKCVLKCPPGTKLIKTNPGDSGTCVPVLPPPTHLIPKPTSPGPITAIFPFFPRPPRVAGVGRVRWSDSEVGRRQSVPACPPGYHYSSRYHTCVPGAKPDPLLHGLGAVFPPVTKPDEVAEAKQALAVWGEKNTSPVSGYKGEGAAWNATDATMLIAFADWWNVNYSVKLATTGVLDSQHLFSLRTYVLTPTQKPGGGGAVVVNVPGGGNVVVPSVEDTASCIAKCPKTGPEMLSCIKACTDKYGVLPQTAPPPVDTGGGGGGMVAPPPAGGGTVTPLAKPAAKSETPWGWIIGGAALAGVAGLAIWSGARGVGGAMAPNPSSRDLLVQWDNFGRPRVVRGPVWRMITLPIGVRDKHGDVITKYTPDWARIGYVKVSDSATMRSPRQSGHEIEGRVTIKGKSYSAFTSGGENPDGGDGMIIVRTRTHRGRYAARANPAPAKMIYWKEIKPEDAVTLEGEPRSQYYVVRKPNGKKFLAHWSGQEAREAQRWLESRRKS